MRLPLLAAACLSLALAACGQGESTPDIDEATGGEEVIAAPTAEMPVDAPPQEEIVPSEAASPGDQAAAGEPGSCLSEVGPQASARLAERCIMVSPATRPPCNAANPCTMIQGEIDRACGQYGPGETKPAECAA
ncbi:MAG: hypothetical protein JHC81_14365 [Brevundimonas sp.]|uniref:hypothetical protein n=1 Tax=Brevundimonas sp. TaxID=1871086 RepID=UPI001A329D7A|nr:hypothetical protein [Brevundimonas sp.]MBJ7448712.1 hypothetical protein [Brevundimonas sp.]